jgi:hypothetical protein
MKQIGVMFGLMLGLAAAIAFAEVSPGSRIVPLADVSVAGTATPVALADPMRLALNCTNTSSSVHVRWGSASVAATTGQRLPAGSAIEIRNTAAVYMISEGASVTISCTKELR